MIADDVQGQAGVDASSTASREGLRFAFFTWLAVRVFLSLWGAVAFFAINPELRQKIPAEYPNVVLPEHDLYGYTIGVWNVFDTVNFITIAETGYGSDPGFLSVFFPGYPLLIKLASVPLLGNSLLAALVVANVSALVFFWYLYRLVEPEYGVGVARRAVILSAVFPTSFFLFLGYTEAPLLAFTVCALYYGREGKWWLAGLLAGVAALVKQPGVFLLLPLAYMYWRQYRTHGREWPTAQRLSWLWLLAAPAAALGYTIYRYLFSGAELADVTDLGAHEILTLPGLPLISALLVLRPDNPRIVFNVIDVAFTLLMISLSIGVALRLRSTVYTLYSVVLTIVSLAVTWPDMFRPEVNMPRRLLIIFPAFIYLGTVIDTPRRLRWMIILSLIIFMGLSSLFINWIFIS